MEELIRFIANLMELLSLVYLAGIAFTAGQRSFREIFPPPPITLTYKMEDKK